MEKRKTLENGPFVGSVPQVSKLGIFQPCQRRARREKRDLSLDSVGYGKMLDKWQKAYGLTPDEMAQIEARCLNAWRAYEGAQYRADGEREKFRAKAEKLGIEAAGIWLD